MAATFAILWASVLSTGLLSAAAFAATVFSATSATIPGQPAGSDSGVAMEIRQLEKARFEAQRRKDVHVLDAMLDNAVVWVDPDGMQWTKADYLAHLRSPGRTVVEIALESMTIHDLGEIVIASGIYHEKGIVDGRPYQQRARFADTWAFKDGGWVCIAAVATSAIS